MIANAAGLYGTTVAHILTGNEGTPVTVLLPLSAFVVISETDMARETNT